jgi:TolB protein
MASSLALVGCGEALTEAPVAAEPRAVEAQGLEVSSAVAERRLIVYQTTSLALYAVDDKGRARLLAERSGAPVTSPDGRQVAYSKLPDSYQAGDPVEHAELHVFNVKAGHVQQVTRGYDDTEPIWTPDGRSLLFQSTRRSGTPALWKVRENGTGLDQVTNHEARTGVASFIPNPASSSTAQWSPDLQRRLIVYGTTSATNGDVRVLDFSRLLEVEAAYSLGEGHSPRWTEHGTVVYTRNEGDKVVHVEVAVD